MPVRTLLTASLFLGTLAYTLYTRVSSTDYEALVLAVKTAGQELYPKISHQTVSTTRMKPVWRAEYSERDPWTATLSQSEDGLVLMKVGGRRTREEALRALERGIGERIEERERQEGLRGEYGGGVEFERRGRR
jgi:hypothetical protein